jgi:hypothetical protein
MNEFRKQISLFLPLSEWKAVRREAARKRIPMTELCRQWLKPSLDKLCRMPEQPIPDDDAEFTHHP